MREEPGLVDAGVPPQAWRAVNPLSPILNVGAALVVILAAVLWHNVDTWRQAIEEGWVDRIGLHTLFLIIAAAVVAIAIIGGFYSWLAWRKMRFAVTNEAVWYRAGILFRHQRHARLERIQSVDVAQPFIPRLLGLGKITVGVAGSGDLSFGYLRLTELQELRAEIMALAAGVEAKEEAPEQILYRVSTLRLVQGMLTKIGTIISLAILVAITAGAIVAVFVLHVQTLWALVTLLPVALAFGAPVLSELSGMYGFTAAASPDGIRVRRGLFDTRSQTVPPRRIHAIRIAQPFFWRPFGWYSVRITQAASGEQAEDVLLPVGTREEALLALWLVIPDLGVDNPVELLSDALEGKGTSTWFTRNTPQSRWLDPLVWRRRGVACTRTALIVRNGRVTRSATFVPYARIQSLAIKSGPMQRQLRLATLSAHLVPGIIFANIKNLPDHVAAGLLPSITAESRVSRESEPPERWMMRAQEAINNA